MAMQLPQETVVRFPILYFGGLNQRDQADMLVPKSHQFYSQTPSYWSQLPDIGMETPDCSDVDYYPQGLGKRQGSTATTASIVSVLVSGDVILHYGEFRVPSSGTIVEYAIGQKAMYTNQSGSWAQINGPWASALSWPSTVAKCTAEPVDGHLIVGLDGSNYLWPWRGGSALDDQMRASTTTTTVNVTSNSGQKVLSVAATSMFQVNDRVHINSGGARDETGYIASISAGTSITLQANLSFTHTNVQADVVQVENKYTQAYGSNTTFTYTGTWVSGNYQVAQCQGRLCYGNGDTLINVTPPGRTPNSGIWDNLGLLSTFFIAPSRIIGMTNFTPVMDNQVNDYLYFNTPQGWFMLPGFDQSDMPLEAKGQALLNYRSFCKARNWIVYLTDAKTCRASNGRFDIDLGSRGKNILNTGVLDGMDTTNSALTAYGVYHPTKFQAMLAFTTGSGRVNDTKLVIDFKRGEPVMGEAQTSYEPRVRLLPWRMYTPDTNKWFAHENWFSTGIKGVLQTGVIYQTESGTNDLDTVLINDYWFTPQINGGDPVSSKQWLTLFLRLVQTGDYSLFGDLYLNRSASPTVSNVPFNNATPGSALWGVAVWGVDKWSGSGVVPNYYDQMAFAEVIQWKFHNGAVSQSWIMTSAELDYVPAATMR